MQITPHIKTDTVIARHQVTLAETPNMLEAVKAEKRSELEAGQE